MHTLVKPVAQRQYIGSGTLALPTNIGMAVLKKEQRTQREWMSICPSICPSRQIFTVAEGLNQPLRGLTQPLRGLMDRQMHVRTDFPCILQDIVPFESTAQKVGPDPWTEK